ncbi:MAG: inverse autotransporter beta domain-containing protein [Planctomycetota bacterium]|nr:inverse autotransporter beta domain-containing protein [Planctomycetota bacterium]
MLTDDSGTISVSDGSYYANGSNFSGSAPLGSHGAYLLFQKQIDSGVGYQGGYSTIGGFVPLYEFADLSIIFGTARLFITDDDHLPGVNAGLGYRHYMEETNQLIGVSAFFDSDQTPSENRYDQLTFGVEWIDQNFELRSNVYLPTNSDSNQIGVLPTGMTPFFEGNQILFQDTGLFENAMKGVDLEYGMPLLGYSWARGYVGTYYYNTPTDDDLVGFRGRLFFNFTNDIATEVAVTDDSLFGTRITVGVQITFSGRPMLTPFPERTVLDKRYDQVFRSYRVAMGASQSPVDTPAINPGTLLPYIITHVDDSNAAPGTGTFEDPFTTLQSSNSDITLVWRGNTTMATPLIGGVTLVNNQRLLGEGVPHTFDVHNRGTFAFSTMGFDDAAPKPFVTEGAVGPVITLANNNEVSGFNIIDTTIGHSAISGVNIKDFDINNVDVTGDGPAFNLVNASGTGRIVDSSFALGAGINSNGVSVVNTATQPLDLTIDNFATASGGLNALRIVANASTIDATVTDFMADANRNGLNLAATAAGTLNIDIADSTFTNASSALVTEGRGALINDVAGTLNLTMDNTDISNAGSHGMEINTSAGGLFTATINDSTFSNAGGNGFLMNFSNTAANSNLTMTNTTVDNAGLDGMNVLVQNNSLLTIDITDGSFLNAGGDAFDTTVFNGSTLNLFVDPTPATGATDNGFLFVVFNNSTLNASFLDSDLGNAGISAIAGSATVDSTATISFVNGSLANNGSNAVNIFADDSDVTLTIDNADAQTNGSNGAQFLVQNGGDLVANISNSNFSNNTLDAFSAAVTGNGSSAVFNLDTVTADFSGDSGFDFSATNNSEFSLTAVDSTFVTSTSHGIFGAIDNSDATVALSGTTVDDSALNGVALGASSGSTVTASFTDATTITNSGNDGLLISLDDSDAAVSFDNAAVTDNGNHGFEFSAVNGSTMTISGNDASFSTNGGDGINGTINGAGSTVDMDITRLVAMDNSGIGMNVSTSNGGQFTADIANGNFTINSGAGIQLIAATNASNSLSLDQSSVSNNGSLGIITTATDNSTTTVDLLNTVVSSNFGTGLFVFADDSTADITLDGNTQINGNFGDGIFFLAQNGSTLTATAPNEFIGRSISNNFESGIDGRVIGPGSSASLNFDQTRIIGNALDGMTLNVSGGAALDVQLDKATITDQLSRDGINTTVTDAASIATFDILNSTISENSDSGFVLNILDGADAEAAFRFASIRNNGLYGIQTNVTGIGSTLDISVDSNSQVTNHDLDGVEINASDFALITNAEFSGQLNTNLGDGLEINLDTNARIDNLLLNESASLSTNFSNGLDLNMDNADVTTLIISSNNSRNQESGNSLTLLNGSTIDNFSYFGFSDENVTNDGMNITVDDSIITNAAISGTLNSNGNRGLEIDLLGTGTITNFQVTSAVVSGNLSDGIDISVLDDAVIDPSISNSVIANNGDSGFELTVNQIAPVNTVNVTINNSNQFIGNDDGVFLHSLNDAEIVALIDSNSFETNAGSGVRVLSEDSSSFGLTGNASLISNNFFTGNGDGIFLNAEELSNHDVDIFGVYDPDALTSTQTFTGNDFGIRILTNSIAGATTRDYDLDGLDIFGNTSDGVNIDLNGQLDDITNVNIGLIDTVVSNSNTSDGFSLHTTGGTNNVVINDSLADANIQDGFRYLHDGGTTTYTLQNSIGTNNSGRGASVDVRAAGSSSLIESNELSNNNSQGLLLATLANSYPSDPIFVDGDPDNPQDYVNNQSADVFTTLIIAQSNTIADNVNNGLAISVGSSTRMNAVVNDNLFSGNTDIDPVDPENSTYDIRIFPVRSVNPTNSIDNASPVLDTVYQDPVAHLDLVFGASGNPVDTKFGNRGEQIDVLGEGTSISASITQTGRFTNNDPLKATHADPITGLDIDRPVIGYFQVHGHNANPVLDLLDGTNVDGGNFFVLSGTVQSMFNTFSGSNFLFPSLGTVFPDPAYP